jgi:hypothetical protein
MATSIHGGNSRLYRYNAAVEEFRETEYPMIKGKYLPVLYYDRTDFSQILYISIMLAQRYVASP